MTPTDQSLKTIEAERMSKSATIHLNGSIQEVFPLFGPVREMEWAEGWQPIILYSSSDVEEHMVFSTPSRYDDEGHYLWTVSKYFPEQNLIEYTVSATDRIWFIRVECFSDRSATRATITYTYTGFTSMAAERNRESIDGMFSEDLKDWERAINHYLLTGEKFGQ
jgi:hypothetical protein